MNKIQPIIKIIDLSIKRSNLILDNLNWQVMPGQNWVILGANGSGKSSLLNALTAYMSPSSGEIYLCGKKYGNYNWPELRKSVGIVSSSIHQLIYNAETVISIIYSGKDAMINRSAKISNANHNQALEILEQVGCSQLANQSWGTLSQGEKQRVLIGRALMAKLELLILDEPCIGLDPVAREQFLEFINNFGHNSKAPTIILVTHHVEEITPIFSHVLILKNGKVLASGAKDEVLSSEILSQAFNSKITLNKNARRFSLDINL